MPTSYLDPTPLIVKTVKYYKPKTVLDIGCGFGKYGFLFHVSISFGVRFSAYDPSVSFHDFTLLLCAA